MGNWRSGIGNWRRAWGTGGGHREQEEGMGNWRRGIGNWRRA